MLQEDLDEQREVLLDILNRKEPRTDDTEAARNGGNPKRELGTRLEYSDSSVSKNSTSNPAVVSPLY